MREGDCVACNAKNPLLIQDKQHLRSIEIPAFSIENPCFAKRPTKTVALLFDLEIQNVIQYFIT